MDAKSIKRMRFEDVAGKRVQTILDKLDLLSNCSNTNNYEYNEDDYKKMFSAIKDKLRYVESKYSEQLMKRSKKKFEF
jgi:hypothetical protein